MERKCQPLYDTSDKIFPVACPIANVEHSTPDVEWDESGYDLYSHTSSAVVTRH